MARSGSSKTKPVMQAREEAARQARQEFAHDVRSGLGRAQKELLSKYLYDELGTALFEAITHLPEYGLTRADTRLLAAHAGEIIAAIAAPVSITELGSGTGQKSRLIVEAAPGRPRYFPIDISEEALAACEVQLKDVAEVQPVHGKYLESLARVAATRNGHETLLVLFLGSTIGNFDRRCATEFLVEVRDRMRPGDVFLLGADLVKPVHQLLAAYDDAAGVTAAFNRNLLGRINRELDADFDLRAFAHEARYDEHEHRIEMHLRATRAHTVHIPGADCTAHFREGETIWTESSHKFRIADLEEMARTAGFDTRATWIDDEWPFAETLWVAC